MKRRAFIAAFKNQHPEYDEAGTDAILGNMTINDEQGYIELIMNGKDGFESFKYKSGEISGLELVPDNTEYNMAITDEKVQTNAALYNKDTDEVTSSLRGAIEISVLGNESLKNQVMKIGGIKGYTSESELMTGN